MTGADPPWSNGATSDRTDGAPGSDGTDGNSTSDETDEDPTSEEVNGNSTSDGVDPFGGGTGRRRLRLSTPFVVLAVLCFATAALTVALTAEAVSNDLAILGVRILAVGVLLRLVEHATGDRLLDGLDAALRLVRATIGRAGSWVPFRSGGLRTDGSDRQGYLTVEDVREGVRLAAVLTLAGSLLLLARWWSDPTRLVSATYLVGWLLGLGLLVAVYVALSGDR